MKLLVISANIQNENDEVATSVSPADFVGLVKYSRMIVSASFHATVFSILLRKDFYSIKAHGKNARISSLLSSLGLESRAIEKVPDKIESVDYSIVNIESINKESVQFLDNVFKAYGAE